MSDLTERIKQASEDACNELDGLAETMRRISADRDKLRSELDIARRDVRDMQATLWKQNAECDSLRVEARRMREELAKLQAEREPRDNGDGTVTAWKPVTYPRGLDVECVRQPQDGEWFFATRGEWMQCGESPPPGVRLIIRPAPKPPEPVTWKAPLADGEFLVDDDYDIHSSDAGRIMTSRSCEVFLRGYTKPPQLGTYQFRDGVGTLIQEAGND